MAYGGMRVVVGDIRNGKLQVGYNDEQIGITYRRGDGKVLTILLSADEASHFRQLLLDAINGSPL